MSTREYKYDAFISYRHAPLDLFVAEKLHKMLENFKVPRLASDELKKQGKDTVKRSISRVFRDRDELPLSSNLSDTIEEALAHSEFLIVICSPRTKESLWVQKEISMFVAMHGREKVLAVLIEGEPDESFPEQLTKEEIAFVRLDGTKEIQQKTIEPLAADVRGKNKKEVEKKLKEELLRLVAPILGCEYDDLKQRHRERRFKRMLTASLVAAGVFLVFGGVSLVMALQIRAQSQIITRQYEDILKRQSISMANMSQSLLKEGDRIAAILVAQEALSEESGYTEQAQQALADALYVYDSETHLAAMHSLKMDGIIEYVEVSPDKKLLLAVDSAGNVKVWNVTAGSEIFSVDATADFTLLDYDGRFGFVDDFHIFAQTEQGIAVYNIANGTEKYHIKQVGSCYVKANAEAKIIVVCDMETFAVYDAVTGTELARYGEEKDWDWLETMTMNPDGTLLAAEVDLPNNDRALVVIDLEKQQIVLERMLVDENIRNMVFGTDGKLAVITVQGELLDYENYEYLVQMFDPDKAQEGNAEPLWERAFGGQVLSELIPHEEAGQLIIQKYDSMEGVDWNDGTTIATIELDNEIVGASVLSETSIMLMGRDGISCNWNPETGFGYISDGFFKASSDNLKQMWRSAASFALLSHQSNCVTVYGIPQKENIATLYSFENFIQDVIVSKYKDRCLVKMYIGDDVQNVFLFDVKERKILQEYQFDTQMYEICFAGENDEYIAAVSDTELSLYDSNGTLRECYTLDGYVDNVFGVDETGTKMVLAIDDRIEQINLTTGEVLLSHSVDINNVSHYFAIGKKQEICVVLETTSGTMTSYDFATMQPKRSVEANVAFITSAFMDETEQFLFVSYLDNTLEVYDSRTLMLLHTYTEFVSNMDKCVAVPQQDAFLLYGLTDGYLCSRDNFESKAFIPGAGAISVDGQVVFTIVGNDLMKVPVLSVEQLLDEAEKQLDGRTLSDEERKKYNLD